MRGRIAFAALFIVAGSLHFILTTTYIRIMPPCLPEPKLLVQISGACEIAGGLGMLVPATQAPAAWGIIALLIAVMPANVYMAMDHTHWPRIPEWLLWARLPMQLPLIWWAWSYTRAAQMWAGRD